MNRFRPQVMIISIMGLALAGYAMYLGHIEQGVALALAIIAIGSALSEKNGA